jgi:NDP-sugar pyrophosphorylase family protein
MRAVILAGGKGTRLAPYTVNFPKPLMPVGDVPVIEVLIQGLIDYRITDITLTIGHLAELMKSYFDQRSSLTSQINLDFVEESEPTGTAGSLAQVQGLDATFLAMNGDLLTDIDFDELLTFHRQQGGILTIAAHERRTKIDLGVIELDAGHNVIDYVEKPELTHRVSMGIYVYEPRVLEYIEPGKYLDFPDLVLRLIGSGEKVSAFVTDCMWLDIGRPDDYARAQEMHAKSRQDTDLA